MSLSTGVERYEGYKRAMKKANLKIDEQYVHYGDFTFQSGYQGAENLMGKQERPTSIVIMNNEMTVGALKYLRTHGIGIPEQVSIATYGNIENIELLYVQPTLVTKDPWTLGMRSANFILERIRGDARNNRELIYEPKLIQGNSVRFFAGSPSLSRQGERKRLLYRHFGRPHT